MSIDKIISEIEGKLKSHKWASENEVCSSIRHEEKMKAIGVGTALQILRASSEGMVLVPEEPTEAMLNAASREAALCAQYNGRVTWKNGYKAMLQASKEGE